MQIIPILKSSLKSGLMALLIFGPITGLLLKGFSIELALTRPLILAGLVVVLRFLAGLFLESEKGKAFITRSKNSQLSHVLVRKPKPGHKTILIAIVLLSACLPLVASKYFLTVATLSLIYVLLGLGLNIVVGLAGLLDLGFVAFYAVGAYGYALLCHTDLGIGFWLAIPICASLAATCGAILGFPVLRMHGDYLAIVTLGFGEIIRLLLNNMSDITRGPNGISVDIPTFFGLEFSKRAKQGGTPFHEYFNIPYDSLYRYILLYLTLLVMVCLTIFLVTRLKKMPIGRAWEALREDEIACRSLGINHVTTKLTAFSMGAMIGGIAGVFFAAHQGYIFPSSFTFIESALILAIVVLGGLGSTTGVVVAALILSFLPEFLREFSEYRMLMFGSLMVLMMIWRPRGLVKIVRQWFDRVERAPNA